MNEFGLEKNIPYGTLGVIVPAGTPFSWVSLPDYLYENGAPVQLRVLAFHALPSKSIYLTSATLESLRQDGMKIVIGKPLRWMGINAPMPPPNSVSAGAVGMAGMAATPFTGDGKLPLPAETVDYSTQLTPKELLQQQKTA